MALNGSIPWQEKKYSTIPFYFSRKINFRSSLRQVRSKRIAETLCFFVLLLFGLGSIAWADKAEIERLFQFNIPQQRADLALTEFAEQADLTLVFPDKLVQKKTANRLVGRYSLKEAVNVLLQGTGLKPMFRKELVLSIDVDEASTTEREEMNIKRKNLLASILGIFALSGTANVTAEDTSTGEVKRAAGVVEEIIVTATKREQSLQDTSMSISALSKDTIDKRNLVGMGDYLSTLPGANVLDQGPGYNSIIIRGVSAAPG